MNSKNKELIFEKRALSDIPFLVLEDAYWRPQDAHLQKHFRLKYEESNKRGSIKEYERLKKFWRQRETWINYSLDCLLMASSPKLLSQVFGELVPSMSLTNPQLFNSNIPGLKADIGVPDFILKDHNALVLGEIKTDALENSHKYSFEQYSKFMLFSALCLCSLRSDIPKNVIHIIIAPDIDAKKLCNDYKRWLPSINANKLHVNAEKLDLRDRKKRFRDFASWKKYLLNFIEDDLLIKQNSLSKDNIQEYRGITTPELAPTHLFTWQQFCDVYVRNAVENGVKNLADTAIAIQSLAVPVNNVGLVDDEN